jgi:DinB superfamily
MNGETFKAMVQRMDAMPSAVAALAHSLTDSDARWRPAAGGWSILEIINHLADEEVEDFRARLQLTLEDPTEAWPPIDPEVAATDRAYNERDLGESVERFSTARADSVAWLGSLQEPDWSAVHQRPSIGLLSVGDLFAAWCDHDALHLRQIAKRLHQLAQRDAAGFSMSYAGEWPSE